MKLKRKKCDYEQFELFDKSDKELTLDVKTKKDKELKLTALPKWLHSKNDFKEAIKLIEDIKTDTNNVKSNGDIKVFNDLNELINNIKNNKTTKKKYHKKIRNIVSDLDQLREKESTVFQNKTNKHYKPIAIDLSKQIELKNPDLRQQINFIGKLEEDKATMFFIIEKSEETTFEFLQNSVSII